MLKTNQKISITGESFVTDAEGKQVSAAGFSALIDSVNPEEISLSVWQNDKTAYNSNRSVVRADQRAFEDFAYAKQDELLAAAQEV